MPFRGDYFSIPQLTGINIIEQADGLRIYTDFTVQHLERRGEISYFNIQSTLKETSTFDNRHSFNLINNVTINRNAIKLNSTSSASYVFLVRNENILPPDKPQLSTPIINYAATPPAVAPQPNAPISPVSPEVAAAVPTPEAKIQLPTITPKNNQKVILPLLSAALRQPSKNMQLVEHTDKIVREGEAKSQYFDWKYKFEFTPELCLKNHITGDSGYFVVNYKYKMERIRFFSNDKFSGTNLLSPFTISLKPG